MTMSDRLRHENTNRRRLWRLPRHEIQLLWHKLECLLNDYPIQGLVWPFLLHGTDYLLQVWPNLLREPHYQQRNYFLNQLLCLLLRHETQYQRPEPHFPRHVRRLRQQMFQVLRRVIVPHMFWTPYPRHVNIEQVLWYYNPLHANTSQW